MTDLQIAILGIIVGGILSWVISWFFFRKAVNKRFGAYIQFSSAVLSGVDDPALRSALEIRYNGTKIEDLFQLQFVVANEGERAIRDVIEPLSMTLPSKAKLLDARVIHVEPDGRTVEIRWKENEKGETKIEFPFSLLNKGEFFIVKLLINGQLDTSRLELRITVDDLPPIIRAKHQSFAAAEDQGATGFRAILLGFIPLGLAVSNVVVLWWLSTSRPDLFPGNQAFHWVSWSTLAGVLSIGGAGYWAARGLDLLVSRGLFKPKQRFILPQRHLSERLARRIQFDLAEELDPDLSRYIGPASRDLEFALARTRRRLKYLEHQLEDEPSEPDPDMQA